jgi:hypothetical protein
LAQKYKKLRFADGMLDIMWVFFETVIKILRRNLKNGIQKTKGVTHHNNKG